MKVLLAGAAPFLCGRTEDMTDDLCGHYQLSDYFNELAAQIHSS
jgi:hypothetical protein